MPDRTLIVKPDLGSESGAVEAAVFANFGPEQRDGQHDQDGSNAAGNDGKDRAKPVGDGSRFKASQFIGGANE